MTLRAKLTLRAKVTLCAKKSLRAKFSLRAKVSLCAKVTPYFFDPFPNKVVSEREISKVGIPRVLV